MNKKQFLDGIKAIKVQVETNDRASEAFDKAFDIEGFSGFHDMTWPTISYIIDTLSDGDDFIEEVICTYVWLTDDEPYYYEEDGKVREVTSDEALYEFLFGTKS